MKCVECGNKRGQSDKPVLCSDCAIKKVKLDDNEAKLLAEYLATILAGGD